MKLFTLLLLPLCLFRNSFAAGSPGLNYNYYEGNWTTIPDFNSLTPVKKGTTTNVSLAPRNKDLQYAFHWNAYIIIPADGIYTFETNSDDGSKLYIDSTVVVNNDGEHNSQFATGNIALTAGVYPVTIDYFQHYSGQTMEVWWSSNSGISRQKIADNAFTLDNPGKTSGTEGGNHYYFSAITGDDTRSAAQARDSTTPWKTINKLNAFMPYLQSGDSILFKRNETFTGNIIIAQSGKEGHPIVFSAYGNGDKPSINGFSILNSWTSVGGGAWESGVAAGSYLNMVLLNETVKGMGRFPNITDTNRGYLTIKSHSGTSQVTGYENGSSVNWTGAEIVVRKNDWVLDRGPITSRSGDTLNFVSPTAHEPKDGYGFFIQNSPLTLDQLGEWYYNPASKKLRMFFGSADPKNYIIKASMIDTLVYISNSNYLTFDNLAFRGADVAALQLNNSTNISIQYCDISNTGLDGISADNCPYMIIQNCTVNHSNNSGIKLYPGSSNASIKNNAVRNSGTIPGMGSSNNQQMVGIFADASNNTIALNTVDSSGYCGITFTGDYTLIKNNVVNYFCLTVSDGGGIYTWGGWDKVGRTVTGNIVLNGIGANPGTGRILPGGAVGIYTDDRSSHIDISNNSVANCARDGIYLHNSHEMNITGNTLYNNGTQLSMIHDAPEPADPIRNVVTTNNVMSSSKFDQFLVENVSTHNDIDSFGSYNNNYYVRPTDQNGIITADMQDSSQYTAAYYDLAGWNTAYGFDQKSVISPVKIPTYTVNKLIGSNKFANGSFDSNIDGVFVMSSPGTATASFSSGKLDGGALQVSFNANGGESNTVGTYIDFGAVTAGKTYVISFSLLSARVNKTIKTFIQQNGGTYDKQTELKYFSLSTTRTENQFLFTAPSTLSDVMIAFEINGSDCPFWLDNFKVYEADVTTINPDDYMRFDYNATSQAKTISLNDTYVDAQNKQYSGTVTLAPFTSLILIKQAASTATQSNAKTTASQAVAKELQTRELTATSIKVSPNPAREQMQVAVNLPENTQSASMSIYSLSGVRLQTIVMSPTTSIVPVDVYSLTSGIYIININYDGHTITKKFVKQS